MGECDVGWGGGVLPSKRAAKIWKAAFSLPFTQPHLVKGEVRI